MSMICPICNGFTVIHVKCKYCGNDMVESGRFMDYFDDYSPYMEIDLMKLEDGIPNDFSQHKCPHLYSCSNCQSEEVILIKE